MYATKKPIRFFTNRVFVFTGEEPVRFDQYIQK